MEIVRKNTMMRACAEQARSDGRTLVLVPTMGALHEGHIALVRHAREKGNHVTVSVFVNPTQFAPGEDFGRYPRDLEADCRRLEDEGGIDAVFVPDVNELYPDGQDAQAVWVDSPVMSSVLCGRHRPGHFRGVLTVIAKLLAICRPHTAVFGLKDVQQYFMIRRMAQDLALPTQIIGAPTIREADGLALSSRNVYLSAEERAEAPALNKAVNLAAQLIESGQRHVPDLEGAMGRTIASAPLAVLQYAEVVTADALEPVRQLEPGMQVVAAAAVLFGTTRLIDNVIVTVPR